MDHVVYVDTKAKELENILSGSKTMILRGATGRKVPYGRVNAGDTLYFIRNNAEGCFKATARVSDVLNSDKMDKEASIKLIDLHQPCLQLTPAQYKRWAGKRYLCLITITSPEEIRPFRFNQGDFKNMDDWLVLDNIDQVRGETVS